MSDNNNFEPRSCGIADSNGAAPPVIRDKPKAGYSLNLPDELAIKLTNLKHYGSQLPSDCNLYISCFRYAVVSIRNTRLCHDTTVIRGLLNNY